VTNEKLEGASCHVAGARRNRQRREG